MISARKIDKYARASPGNICFADAKLWLGPGVLSILAQILPSWVVAVIGISMPTFEGFAFLVRGVRHRHRFEI